MRIYLFIAALYAFFTISFGKCGFSWGVAVQGTSFENISSAGHFYTLEKLGCFTVSTGEIIFLHANFDSGRKTSSKYFGAGWFFNMGDVSVLPCGKSGYALTEPDTTRVEMYGGSSGIYQSKSWNLKVAGGRMTADKPCGASMSFYKESVRSASSGGVRLDFTYEGGRLSGISEKNIPLVKIEYGESGNEILVNFCQSSDFVKISMEPIKASEKILKRIEFKNGETAEYDFDFSNPRMGGLNYKNREGDRKAVVWHADTGIVESESIKRGGAETRYDYDVAWQSSGNKIRRVNGTTGKPDVFYYDPASGLETIQTEGGPILHRTFMPRGIAGGNTRTERVVYGGGRPDDEYRYVYDDKGRLVRKFKNSAVEFSMRYDDKANSITYFGRNGEFVWKKSFDALGRVLSHERADGKNFRYRYLDNGMTEVLARDGARASKVLFDENLRVLSSSKIN